MTSKRKPAEVALPSRMGKPALRALASQGIADLRALARWSEDELGALHGVGPKALRVIHEAMKDAGLSLRGERASGASPRR